ncbi:DUF6274 family protein [Streptomyces monashensis]|uniref:Uncharacterized protein n=1 Tax=Streptomyces monashensis TaxID=1678012 RepID=A0A1S2QJZ5_9ACTN|nr:DUF6274 family protein [Streptomyces monashensis]OIK05921.1 hypothetical protein BIV23_11555 [Streptomyces monashensis]
MGPSARHETRALLRAHLAAASPYRHLTRHCPVCHHLLRLAMDAGPRGQEAGDEDVADEGVDGVEDPRPA